MPRGIPGSCTHGTASTYHNRGCRCEPCCKAARVDGQKWWRANKNRYRENDRVRSRQWRLANRGKVRARNTRHKVRKRQTTVEVFTSTEVYERDNWVCQLCSQLVDPEARGADGPSLDHVIPLSLGGYHTRSNTQLAHRWCNSRKGAKLDPQYELAGVTWL